MTRTYCKEAWRDADGTRTHYCTQTGPHDTHWCGICGPDCTPPDECEDGMSKEHAAEDDAPDEVVYGAVARAMALAADDPDWMNVTRWPRVTSPR